MRDINLVKDNVRKMIEQDAPESDIDEYLGTEGYTPDQLRLGQPQQPEREAGLMEKTGQFLQGVPQGLGNKMVGAVQTVSGLVAPESEFTKNLGKQVGFLNQRQAALPSAERAGVGGGEILGDVMLTSKLPFKGITANAAAGGAVSGLTSTMEDPSNSARAGEVLQDTAYGAIAGKGLELVGKGAKYAGQGVKNVASGVMARTPEQLKAVGEVLKKKATDLYDAADQFAGGIKPNATKKILSEVNKSVLDDGALFKTNHPDTISILGEIEDDISKKGFKIGIKDIEQYRKSLGDTIRKNTDKLTGEVSADGRKLIIAANKLETVLDNLPTNYLVNAGDKRGVELFKQANKEYGQYRRFQKVANLVEDAQGDPNLIKRKLATFVQNKKNLQGMNAEQRGALKRAATLTAPEGIFKMLGKFGLDLGSSITQGNAALPALAAVGTGLGVSSGAGVATIAGGTGARQVQKYLARGKLEEAVKLLEGVKNPSAVIAKIPNRKLQEKLLDRLLAPSIGGAIGESSEYKPNEAQAANPDYTQLARNDFNQARETRYEPTEEDIARRAEIRRRQAIKELRNRYEKEKKTLKEIPDDEELKRILRM